MPLHLFQDASDCHIDNNHIETLATYSVGLFKESQQILIR